MNKHFLICPECHTEYEVEDLTGKEGLDFCFICENCGNQWAYKDAYSEVLMKYVNNEIDKYTSEVSLATTRKENLEDTNTLYCIIVWFCFMMSFVMLCIGSSIVKEAKPNEYIYNNNCRVCFYSSGCLAVIGCIVEVISITTKKNNKKKLEKKIDESNERLDYFVSYKNDKKSLKIDLDKGLYNRMCEVPNKRITEYEKERSIIEEQIMKCKKALNDFNKISVMSNKEKEAKKTVLNFLEENINKPDELTEEIEKMKGLIEIYNFKN